MKILNLEKISKIKRGTIINEYCRGQFSSPEAFRNGGVGVAGLRYLSGAEKVDEIKTNAFLRSNIEIFREGLGFYLREEKGNYLLLIRFDEILNITYFKEIDLIKRKMGFSLFQFSIRKGIPYHYSKLLLMEDEMIELNTPKLKIITSQLDEIEFEVNRKNPMKIPAFFERLDLKESFMQEYETYKMND